MISPLQTSGIVYILTNKNHTVLYTGVTSNLFLRMQQHISKYYTEFIDYNYEYNNIILIYVLIINMTYITNKTTKLTTN